MNNIIYDIADMLCTDVQSLDPSLLSLVAEAESLVNKVGSQLQSRQIAALIIILWRRTQ